MANKLFWSRLSILITVPDWLPCCHFALCCPMLPCCLMLPYVVQYCHVALCCPMLPCCPMLHYVAMLPYVAICSPMLPNVAMLPYVAICCPMLPYVPLGCPMLPCCPMLPYVPLCCPMLPYVALCCPRLPHVALCCLMLPYVAFVALCCAMLPYVALCCLMLPCVFLVLRLHFPAEGPHPAVHVATRRGLTWETLHYIRILSLTLPRKKEIWTILTNSYRRFPSVTVVYSSTSTIKPTINSSSSKGRLDFRRSLVSGLPAPRRTGGRMSSKACL